MEIRREQHPIVVYSILYAFAWAVSECLALFIKILCYKCFDLSLSFYNSWALSQVCASLPISLFFLIGNLYSLESKSCYAMNRTTGITVLALIALIPILKMFQHLVEATEQPFGLVLYAPQICEGIISVLFLYFVIDKLIPSIKSKQGDN